MKEAENLGIKASNYLADSLCTEVLYSSLAKNVASYRNTGKIADNWSENINKGVKIRKNKR